MNYFVKSQVDKSGRSKKIVKSRQKFSASSTQNFGSAGLVCKKKTWKTIFRVRGVLYLTNSAISPAIYYNLELLRYNFKFNLGPCKMFVAQEIKSHTDIVLQREDIVFHSYYIAVCLIKIGKWLVSLPVIS